MSEHGQHDKLSFGPYAEEAPGSSLAKVRPLTVAAVVVTRNRWSFLQQALKALKEQTVPLSEVIVVDNASEDETQEQIRQRFAWASYVRLDKNVGGAGGFEEGVRLGHKTGHDWLWIMDDDAVPQPDALQQLLETKVILNKETGLLACMVVGTDGEPDQGCRARWLDMRNFQSKPIHDGHDPAAEAIECNSATFVGLLVNRNAIDRVGFPRGDFFIAYDDVEYIHRICKAGFKAYQIPRSRIVHLSRSSAAFYRRGSIPLWRNYYDWRNSVYLMSRYSSPVTLANRAGRLAAKAVLFGDGKLQRLRILVRAISDGRAGRLGPKMLPPQ